MGFCVCVCHRTPIKDSFPVVKSIFWSYLYFIYYKSKDISDKTLLRDLHHKHVCTHERFREVLIVLKGIYPHKNTSMVTSYCYLLLLDLNC
jgi:hypothetical protein